MCFLAVKILLVVSNCFNHRIFLNITVFYWANGKVIIVNSFLILQIVVSGMISTSKEISKSKPCELEKALKFIIEENTNTPCRFSSLTIMSSGLTSFGIVDVVLHCLILAITLVFGTRQIEHSKMKLIPIWIFYIAVSVFDQTHICIFTIS